jgi:hypothetical protein
LHHNPVDLTPLCQPEQAGGTSQLEDGLEASQ